MASPGLALQIQQQVSGGESGPGCVTTDLQSPQGPAGKMRGQQTAVQVVQQVNQAGQVVHQLLQTVPQQSSSPAPASLQSSMAPLSPLGKPPPLPGLL